jgi:hypothetical protein
MPTHYYNFARILSHNAVLNFIPGGRGIGKTYGAKKLVIAAGLKSDDQFIYVRRYKEELEESRKLFFDDIAHVWPKHDFMTTRDTALTTPKLIQLKDESDKDWHVHCNVNISTVQVNPIS